MFEKFMEKLGKREEENMEFKPFPVNPANAEAKEAVQQSAPVQSNEAKPENVELKVVRPESFEEVGSIADFLLGGCTVVLNLEVLDQGTTLRVLDFLNGVTYCTEGEIKRVAPNTFIITPHANVDISDM